MEGKNLSDKYKTKILEKITGWYVKELDLQTGEETIRLYKGNNDKTLDEIVKDIKERGNIAAIGEYKLYHYNEDKDRPVLILHPPKKYEIPERLKEGNSVHALGYPAVIENIFAGINYIFRELNKVQHYYQTYKSIMEGIANELGKIDKYNGIAEYITENKESLAFMLTLSTVLLKYIMDSNMKKSQQEPQAQSQVQVTPTSQQEPQAQVIPTEQPKRRKRKSEDKGRKIKDSR